MKLSNLSRLAIAAGALSLAAPAAAIDYIIDLSGNGLSATGSISTDGTIGVLDAGNITAFTFNLDDGFDTFTITEDNAETLFGGAGFIATLDSLRFNFSNPDAFALFQNPIPASGRNFICFAGGLCGGGSNRVSITVRTFGGGIPQTGNQIVGSVGTVNGAVPEPATWAMMLLGFAATGMAMRRRKQANVTFSYA
ncbi:PEPxxWA-CTERM sorting domain-containing protein [Qipengyuania atrilutea]|uniref:PEP-CTERM sorting domain-containing protein n=1 Tax=Qipengyuania atrilutea TaxID=2744473 RepID=A0A850H0R6_9SPHN|nr:PEPxxWA-CTERM sorting domain-containing protein [Actirhodobacter atriluteus]NVD44296.1 PEP-CTERM sorting domain-containing protein [Actirhodobacter atriluteus]